MITTHLMAGRALLNGFNPILAMGIMVGGGAAGRQHIPVRAMRPSNPLHGVFFMELGMISHQARTVRGPLGPIGAHWRPLVVFFFTNQRLEQ